MSQKRHSMHGRDHLPWGADPIPGTASFHPHGIFGGAGQPKPDPTDIDYLEWTNTNFGVVTSESNGEFAVVSAAAYSDGTYSSDRATYPTIFCFIEAPGIYLCTIHVHFTDVSAPPSTTVRNYLEWVPGGYLSGGGGAGYPERQQNYYDNAAAPVSYRGAVQDIHGETLIYVPPSMTPTPCSRFRAHSDYSGYDSLSVSGAVWKIGDWG